MKKLNKRASHDSSVYRVGRMVAAPLGTPGATIEVNAGIAVKDGKRPSMFQSHEEAFKAHRAYLIRQGFKPIGSKELIDPVDGRVLVLTRPGKFGRRLRGGKNRNTARRYGMIV